MGYFIAIVALIVIAFFSASLWMPRSWYRAMLYPGGRPNALARRMNSASARLFAAGIFPESLVSLETVGRRTGRVHLAPLVMAETAGERYLVSMLGESANWVQNVRAAHGIATLHHGVLKPYDSRKCPSVSARPSLRRFFGPRQARARTSTSISTPSCRSSPGSRPYTPSSA